MIPRDAAHTLRTLAKGFPIVVITGPRQSGKSTLAKTVFPKKRYVTLEDDDERERASEDPRGFISRFPDGAIFDEVQRCPKLFSYLQTRVDASGQMGHFVLTGSQQFGLLSGITQSLAGRAGMLELLPLSIRELRQAKRLPPDVNTLLWKGLYPALYSRRISPPLWYASYVTTYLERDVRQLLGIRDLQRFRTFLKLCAAHVGQIVDQVALGNACGISHVTVRQWLSVLEASYIVFLLTPYFRNFGKRLVKRPKLYFYDPALAAFLLQIQNSEHLAIHPARGGLFESLVVADWMKERFCQALPSNAHFWRDNTGHEVDLILEESSGLSAIEMKATQTVSPNLFMGLQKWKDIVGKEARQISLVYGGDSPSVFQGMKVLPWSHLWP